MKLQKQDVLAGRYRLLRRIGAGGFSEVWLAADQMTNDREVALKVYVPNKGMDQQGIKMFVREYEIVADLNHPGLLKATHFDVYDGSPFLVMPFCSAGSLHSRIMERGSLPEEKMAEVLEQTAGALAFLHSKGVMHQDIKPGNVLIDGDDNYLLTDFGISSRMRSTMRKSTSRKESMTVAYAPPERFSGSTQAVPASDIFSLGVMIFEMATGDLPWMGAGGAIVRSESEPLDLPSDYSEGLEHLMRRCLQYDPDKRPTAEEVQIAASNYRSSGCWGAVGDTKSSGGVRRWWLWVLVALAALTGGYGLYTIVDSQDGPVIANESVIVDSVSDEEVEVGNRTKKVIDNKKKKLVHDLLKASGAKSYGEKEVQGILDYHDGDVDQIISKIFRKIGEEVGDDKIAEIKDYYGITEETSNTAEQETLQPLEPETEPQEPMQFADVKAAQKKRELQAEESAWSSAERSDTKAGYEDYLKEYPEGLYAPQAWSQINEIEAREQAEVERTRSAYSNPVEKAAEEIASTMVQIDGGTFKMGCTSEQGDYCYGDEHPVHEVFISGFQLNKYEVTQEQWRTIMGSDPEELNNTGCDRCPVEGVSWDDAQQFIRKLNRISGEDYRLPTEAEWEYAARGGQQSRGYKYSGSDRIDAVAWHEDNAEAGNPHGSKGTTRPVGGKRANELGLYDMSGNVYEWCSDWYSKDYYERSPRNNPGGTSRGTRRVLRGGSWFYGAWFCRVSNRNSYTPGFNYDNRGLRLAR